VSASSVMESARTSQLSGISASTKIFPEHQVNTPT
jgi:hypothetical protein